MRVAACLQVIPWVESAAGCFVSPLLDTKLVAEMLRPLDLAPPQVGGLGWAGLGWAGLGWAGLGWAGLGRAGLGVGCGVAWRGVAWAARGVHRCRSRLWLARVLHSAPDRGGTAYGDRFTASICACGSQREWL